MMLSIVVAAFNAAETLATTLDSLLAQTRRDWEAIIVDDGSVDATRQIAAAYVARDPRFRLLSDTESNAGVSNARNRGIDIATGKWLHFLDADDWVEPAFVEKMVGVLEASPGTKVAYCSARNVTADGRVGTAVLSDRIARAPFETLARECPLLIHSIVIERALVVALGGFDPALKTDEDSDLWQRVARTGTGFRPVSHAVVFYQARPRSLSTDMRRRLADARLVVARGFERDPRVSHPDPRYAEGLHGGEGKPLALAYFSLRAAAFDIGEGGTGLDLVEPFPPYAPNLLGECSLRIIGGLTAGARLLPTDPLSDDPIVISAVRALLAQVERATAQPGLARLLECALEPEIFRPERLTERLVVGTTLFVRQEIDRLQPIGPCPQADRLHIEFRKHGQCLGHAELLLFGGLSTREVAEAAIRATGPRVFLEHSELKRRPALWLQVGIEILRLPRRLPLAPAGRSLRVVARDILVDAAQAVAGARTSPLNQRALADLVRAECAREGVPTRATRAGVVNFTLPILMYHRIADDGPISLARYRTSPGSFAAQMKVLRRAGYRAITSRDLLSCLHTGKPLEGRPVLITFDDAYRDFHDMAWPILRGEHLTAEVLVVTDLVEGCADWDAAHGSPAPLMNWPQIRSLAAAGVCFGSHMASHRHMMDLSSREIVREAVRSRAVLEKETGQPCVSIALPYGEAEPGFDRVAAQSGYEVGFGITPGWVRPGLDPLALPRLEVRGGWSIEAFEQALHRQTP
jgi:glycosyltransferase involved in cell wall biosynthesis/peptidoglycan/xylan/chitin deacetylase (PgdA/CDA1 family)